MGKRILRSNELRTERERQKNLKLQRVGSGSIKQCAIEHCVLIASIAQTSGHERSGPDLKSLREMGNVNKFSSRESLSFARVIHVSKLDFSVTPSSFINSPRRDLETLFSSGMMRKDISFRGTLHK